MKSSISNTTEINWGDPIESLSRGKKPSPTFEKLAAAGIQKISDLLWILPLRIHKSPAQSPFREAQLDEFFRGSGKVIHVERNFWWQGKAVC